MASMDLASASVTATAPSHAAQYVRMSTEHQQYSPENQLAIIRQYAVHRVQWESPQEPFSSMLIGAGGKRESETISHLYGCRREKPSGGPIANDLSQLVLSRKCNDHFRGARGVPINEQYDMPLKWLVTQSFRFEHHWLLVQHRRSKLQGKRPECPGR